jgi:hypothetical protein
MTSTHLLNPIAGALFAGVLLASPDASAQIGPPPPQQIPVVVTTGQAVIRRAPDQAFVSASAETRARSPRDAQQQNAQAMTAVQQKLVSAGVPKDAIRTMAYEVEPEFDFASGRRTLRGYVARNTIEVRVDDLARIGEIVDVAVASGATTIGGIRFELKDRREVERQALREAVADARARAEAASAGAGRTVERIIRIEEGGAPPVEPPRPVMMMRAEAAAPETPIVPGVIEVRATVSLTAQLK